MTTRLFQSLAPVIEHNQLLREPQVEAYAAVEEHFTGGTTAREAGVVLPVGCGKSGLITLVPFAVRSVRTLVVAPGVRIAGQLLDDFRLDNDAMFYKKCAVLPGPEYPEPAEIRGASSNRGDLDEADVVITNIQQLQGSDNRWLNDLPPDFFDLIIFDEAHHNVAESWELLRQKFPAARVVNVSATPTRADGRRMTGEIVYSYSIFKAVQSGFVKHVTGRVLNPKTLQYVRRRDGQEVTVDLAEVRRLGETDADFRRSIVSSERTLSTIVDASIRELQRLRVEADEPRLKIIASALNMEHCKQIVAAYEARNLKAAYIHSREDQQANRDVLAKLERHELDVIVQVRMLGEGFDHPYLAVAAVFSIFAHLSPFVQFVGRIMRVVTQGQPGAAVNRGVVVFHAGANTTTVWDDFREFAEADQEWFQLLVDQDLGDDEAERAVDPQAGGLAQGRLVDVTAEEGVRVEEVPLLSDQRLREALAVLTEHGVTPEEYARAQSELQPIGVMKQAKRQADRRRLDATIQTRASALVHKHGLNPAGHDLDRKRLGRENWLIVKADIDKRVNALVGRGESKRPDFTQQDIDQIFAKLDAVVAEVEQEFFGAGA